MPREPGRPVLPPTGQFGFRPGQVSGPGGACCWSFSTSREPFIWLGTGHPRTNLQEPASGGVSYVLGLCLLLHPGCKVLPRPAPESEPGTARVLGVAHEHGARGGADFHALSAVRAAVAGLTPQRTV